MNRLWVRLGLMICGVLFLVFFLQFLGITADQARRAAGEPAQEMPAEGPGSETSAEIARRLMEFAGLALIVGLGGGLVIGRVVSAPIEELVAAAQRVGRGERAVRVRPRGSREMMELAGAFNAMAADLQHADALRNNLMADVSHELRTPLAALEGNLRAALDGAAELGAADIAALHSQTRHLIRLVNDLRELALAEAGRLPLERAPTDLNALVTDALQALEPLAAENGVTLADELPLLPAVSADPDRVRQVLFNLLVNALRHTPLGGRVTVGGSHSAGAVTIWVADTGEGLDGSDLAAVFDRFYRADRSRSRQTGGSGLGLAIVKALVEAHGGQVAAESPGRGQGSRFVFSLPLSGGSVGPSVPVSGSDEKARVP